MKSLEHIDDVFTEIDDRTLTILERTEQLLREPNSTRPCTRWIDHFAVLKILTCRFADTGLS
ncbi:MAG: hypothetical protein C0482_22090 [Gordonia sp.]|nr:hypothetical protein [Gordonia sp. (in: high G+C Gram-positive bacteria)]